jgi:5'-3' exonuclease
MSQPIHLIDASIYVFRGYFSLPDTFVSKSGEAVNAVYGYTGFLLDLLDGAPTHASLAFDESLTTCYRNDIYPEYKANRELPDENLKYQFEKCQEITALMGLHFLSMEAYEADDIIGTLQAKLAKNRPVIIVTRDKDLGQLLRADDLLWDFAADDFAGPAEVEQKFGVTPLQIADYLALAGDSVDNIPGAPGIGAKTAAQLLNRFGSLDGIYERLHEVESIGLRGAARVKKTLEEHEETIRMFREITQIKTDIEMDVKISDLAISASDREGIETFCDEMNFGARMRNRLEAL